MSGVDGRGRYLAVPTAAADQYSSWHNGLRCDRCSVNRNVHSSGAVIASNQGESLAWIIEAVNEHERLVHS